MLFSPSVYSAETKCVVGNKKIVSVILLEKRSDGRGFATRESVTVFQGERAPLAFRTPLTTVGKWRIPSECMGAMKRMLSSSDITRVLEAIPQK